MSFRMKQTSFVICDCLRSCTGGKPKIKCNIESFCSLMEVIT